MKRTTPRRLFILLTALLLLSLLISCGASPSDSTEGYLPNASDKSEAMGGMSSSGTDGSVGMPESGDELYERKIIRTVNMSCETKSFDEALAHILDTLAAYDGFVQASSVKGTGYNENGKTSSARIANYTLRVPAEALDAYLAALRADEGIRITYQSSTSNEITSSYYDITTRIATLETERDTLQQMLASFTDYADMDAMLAVQERLYNVIEEIESLKTQLKIYDDKVDLSTIELSLTEVFTYTQVATPTFGERMGEAFSESWQDFARGCQNFAVNFVYAFPTLLVLGVIGGGIALIIVISVKRRRKKRMTVTQQFNQNHP